ncbi:ankyrin repeat domain-containing protein [Candidatus Babeliales bacterium]|nr:ankyrin repeat domain-containing protein [Candidatus Babeliales bacterium]
MKNIKKLFVLVPLLLASSSIFGAATPGLSMEECIQQDPVYQSQYPVHCAALLNDLVILKYRVLLRCKPVDIYDGKGNTPLMLAVQFGNYECVEFLLKYGADATQQNSFGMTPLHFAALKKNAICIRLLVNHLFETKKLHVLFMRDGRGNTPLDLGAEPATPAQEQILVDGSREARTNLFVCAQMLKEAERSIPFKPTKAERYLRERLIAVANETSSDDECSEDE